MLNTSLLHLRISALFLLLLINFVLPGHPLFLLFLLLHLRKDNLLRIDVGLRDDLLLLCVIGAFPIDRKLRLSLLLIEDGFQVFQLSNVAFSESYEDTLGSDVGQGLIQGPSVSAHQVGG
jgi:hypothetical protein